jgi:hypothetical protein
VVTELSVASSTETDQGNDNGREDVYENYFEDRDIMADDHQQGTANPAGSNSTSCVGVFNEEY